MGFMEKLFGPSKQKVAWQQLAEEIDGEFTSSFMKGSKVVAQFDSWTVGLDTYTISTGKSSTTYTRMWMPFINQGDFRFKLYNAGFFSKVGKFFGMQDVEIGEEAFDDKYIVKANNEDLIRQLLSSEMLRFIIDNHPKMHLEIKDSDGGLIGVPVSDKVTMLYFEDYGVITDIDRLKSIYVLFSEVIKQLISIGIAAEENPLKKDSI